MVQAREEGDDPQPRVIETAGLTVRLAKSIGSTETSAGNCIRKSSNCCRSIFTRSRHFFTTGPVPPLEARRSGRLDGDGQNSGSSSG